MTGISGGETPGSEGGGKGLLRPSRARIRSSFIPARVVAVMKLNTPERRRERINSVSSLYPEVKKMRGEGTADIMRLESSPMVT